MNLVLDIAWTHVRSRMRQPACAVAPPVQTKGILRHASRDVSVSITGIDPQREPKVSQLATQMRQGTLTSLYRTSNAMILGDRLAEKIGARVGSNITLQTSAGAK